MLELSDGDKLSDGGNLSDGDELSLRSSSCCILGIFSRNIISTGTSEKLCLWWKYAK